VRACHEAVVRLLLAHAAVDANQADKDGATPLFIAAKYGHKAMVRLLFAHAAVDANQATQDGATPRFIAEQNGHEAVVRLLLAHAALGPAGLQLCMLGVVVVVVGVAVLLNPLRRRS